MNPMHGDVRAGDVAEYVEWYRLMGVRHFTFYNQSNTNAHTNCMLEAYRRAGIVDVVQYHTGLTGIVDFPTIADVLSHNDCLYRRQQAYGHTLGMDLDELLVPRSGQPLELGALLERVQHRGVGATGRLPPAAQVDGGGGGTADDKTTPTSVGSYRFQSAFFYTDRPGSALPRDAKLRQRVRVRDPEPQGTRSKWIAAPASVVLARTHQVFSVLPGVEREVHVPPELALIHHYRNCETGNASACHSAPTTEDRSLDDFLERLQLRALAANRAAVEICGAQD